MIDMVPTSSSLFSNIAEGVSGSIVRIAPHEVSIADVDAAKIMYRVGGSFRKSEWYNVFTGSLRHRSLFTMVDPKQHGAHRRLTAFNFSEKWVANLEPFIAKNVKLAIDRMAEEEKMNGFVDVFKWYMFMVCHLLWSCCLV
jgi:cytochrome P450